MKLFIFFFLLNIAIIAQNKSYIQNFNFYLEPSTEYFFANHISNLLENKRYLNKVINNSIETNGLLVTTKMGFTNKKLDVYYSFAFVVPEFTTLSHIYFITNNATAMIIDDIYFGEHTLNINYAITNNVGFGISYKLRSNSFKGFSNIGDKIEQLFFTNKVSLFCITIPFKYTFKYITIKSLLNLSIGGSIINGNYWSQFLNFQNPNSPSIPNMFVDNNLFIQGTPHYFQFNIGIEYNLKNLPIEFYYKLQNIWSKNEYSEIWNSFTLSTKLFL